MNWINRPEHVWWLRGSRGVVVREGGGAYFSAFWGPEKVWFKSVDEAKDWVVKELVSERLDE